MSAQDAAAHRGALFIVFVLAIAGAFASEGWPRAIFAAIIFVPVPLWITGSGELQQHGLEDEQQDGADCLHGEGEPEGTVGHDRGHSSPIGRRAGFREPRPPEFRP